MITQGCNVLWIARTHAQEVETSAHRPFLTHFGPGLPIFATVERLSAHKLAVDLQTVSTKVKLVNHHSPTADLQIYRFTDLQTKLGVRRVAGGLAPMEWGKLSENRVIL